jgi:hypothetical protein
METNDRVWRPHGVITLSLVLGALAALCTVACRATSHEDSQTTPAPADAPVVRSPADASGGMKAYVDPETGELTETPPPGAEPMPGDLRGVPPGAAEQPMPGGGAKIHLGDDADEEEKEPAGR